MGKLFEHAPCIYFSASDDGTLLEVNNFLCASLGYDAAELTGKNMDTILTTPSRIFRQTHFFPLLKLQGFTEEIYLTMLKSNEEPLPVLINAVRKQVDDMPVCLYTGIVVHNRKKFEEELISAKKSAEAALYENVALAEIKAELQRHIEVLDKQIHQAEKQNHELRQFNHVVGHHLQEPVRKLTLFNSLLQQQNKDADSTPLINKIAAVTGQMREVLSDLQKYLWLQETLPNKKMIELDKLIDGAAEKLSSEFPGVELHIEKDHMPPVEGDEEQLQLLFYHLLSNAVRFRKDPVRVIVTISVTALKLNQFRYIAEKYKYTDFLRLCVKDEGIGFDGAFNNRAFEIFRRLHNESGRGVGLTLCKKIVDNHLGNIKIESEQGKGAMVTVELPLNVVAKNAVI